MAVDINKIWKGVITEINLNDGNTSYDSGALADGALVMKAEPVKISNSNKEEIIVNYDISVEATLRQIKDYASLLAFNNVATDVTFTTAGEDKPKLTGIRLNIGIEGDFGKEGGAVIKITGKKRIETSQLTSVFSFVSS